MATLQAGAGATVCAARLRLNDEHGSGTILMVGLIATVIAVTALVIPLYWALSVRHALAGATDAAALAAADTASGLIAGYPCDNATRLASANDSLIEDCVVDGRIVTVTASRRILGILVTTSATAGPPPTRAD
ncbi:Rv3654c family TadE-like protein [Salinibacterium sp. NK8237]|uniref:Rv3654c family TadE-like protein n=1 Tax=Salinibacterium sp. NK8237 TaxID=2792038 RepID=UPI0018CF4B6A|nr:Rv3654c family TadE-like protein [Salinibacterium sp. NK8237]MBH0131001.1 flp pilus-assembly TadE/G-like family protein [Salinibacterium sp. NK8237]